MTKPKALLVLGIMSGTSIDSVDYALCAIRRGQIKLVKYWQVDYPDALRARLHAAARNAATGHELAQLHHDVGRFFAQHALRNRGQKPNLVGLHGQTVFHNPASRHPATLQIGEAAYLVEKLKVPVISNFRAADLAAGGEGAPLATMFHAWVFARRGEHICVNNLGGISNVTSLDWTSGGEPRILAFDTGPANVLSDIAVRHLSQGKLGMDVDGKWAAQGQACQAVLKDWLKHPFFRRTPPKSTGREMFGELFFERVIGRLEKQGLSKFDILATFNQFTARSLSLNYKMHLPSAPTRVILTGGGALNPVLVQNITRELNRLWPAVQVVTGDGLGWPLQSIEPAAFALLAWLRWQGLPGNIPATTGARRAVLLGQVSEP